MLVIDGALGEGGGQVLRTALGLSLLTGQPFRIERIRARRERPGLRQQHLTAVRAAAAVGRAVIEGDALGSQELTFRPAGREPGEYRFDVGTAGSTTLVLQTVLPALLLAHAPSRLVIRGGTHNPQAPPFEFLAGSFLPLLERMGPHIRCVLERPGFYPRGGGRVVVAIEPARRLAPLWLRERGELRARRARALVAGLPLHIAERELEVVRRRLGWGGPGQPAELRAEPLPADCGPGNALVLELECAEVTAVFTGFGQRGVRAEQVAAQVCEQARRWLEAGGPGGGAPGGPAADPAGARGRGVDS